jgi:hypothetical protein
MNVQCPVCLHGNLARQVIGAPIFITSASGKSVEAIEARTIFEYPKGIKKTLRKGDVYEYCERCHKEWLPNDRPMNEFQRRASELPTVLNTKKRGSRAA